MRSKISALGVRLLPKNLYSRLTLVTTVSLIIGYFIVYAAYQNIEPEEVASNAIITSTLMGKIKNNLDTLNTQVTDLTATVVASSIWSKVGSDINYTAGKVGVWATTGNAELDIQSGIKPHWGIYHDSTTEELRFWNGDNRVVIGSTGNVGIGTTIPSALTKLEVNWGINSDFLTFPRSDNNVGNMYISSRPFTSAAAAGARTDDLIFSLAGGGSVGEAMRIKANGNVGIGTASPSAKLQVAGDTVSSRFYSINVTTAGTPSGVPVTIYNATGQNGLYLVSVYNYDDALNYGAFAIVTVASGSARVLYNIGSPYMVGITTSGSMIQATQNSGATGPITATLTKLQ